MSRLDHFELFALPARFALDEAALERAHKGVQSKVHPDRFAAGSAAERRVAMQWAAQANEAFRTLKSPLARAAYLCERAGFAVEAGSNTAMPVDFLLQQMQWREALEEARAQADATQLAALARFIDQERADLLASIEDSIDEQADFAAAAGLVRRLMFIEKFREELGAVQQALPRRASA